MVEATGSMRILAAEGLSAHPEQVWRAWTTPATWGSWDRGLRGAYGAEPFVAGARGELEDLSSRRSTFRVLEVTDGRRCVVEVPLPGARLVLIRTLLDGATAGCTRLRHQVQLRGPLSLIWAVLIGRGFRRQLGPTVEALVRYVEQQP